MQFWYNRSQSRDKTETNNSFCCCCEAGGGGGEGGGGGGVPLPYEYINLVK